MMDSYDGAVNSNDDLEPEGRVPDLDLSQHVDGYWPSSKNVTQ